MQIHRAVIRNGKNIVVAVTAASGAIYARLTLEALLRSSDVGHIALIYSTHAAEVAEFEDERMPEDERISVYRNDDMFAPPASGSAAFDAMIVVPCSAGTLGRIASGVSQTLIERAADVMLKERRPLVLALREAPYSLIHLRNMATVTECGAVVIPASPSFYSRPKSFEELCGTVVERILQHAGVESEHYEWKGR